MNMLRIAIWDLRRIAKDWRAAIWMLALPLVFAFVFGNAFRGGGQQSTWVPVIDLDRSDLSATFIEQLREDGYYIDVKGAEDQKTLISKWPYGVVIPAQFQAHILKGEKVKISVVKKSAQADRLLEVQACVTRAVMRLTAGLAIANVCHRPWDESTRAQLKEVLAAKPLLTVTRKSDQGLRPPATGFYLSLPGMLVMMVLQMILIYGGVTLVEDRRNGQFARLTMAPTHLRELYVGKVLARIFTGMLQAGILLFGGALLFKMEFGNHPLFLMPVLASYAIFAGSLSILAGVVCQTEKQVVQIGIFLAISLASLGGCWWPIEVVPESFKTIAMFTPTYWGLHGVQSVMYFNRSAQVLTYECPIILTYAAACLALSALVIRRRTK